MESSDIFLNSNKLSFTITHRSQNKVMRTRIDVMLVVATLLLLRPVSSFILTGRISDEQIITKNKGLARISSAIKRTSLLRAGDTPIPKTSDQRSKKNKGTSVSSNREETDHKENDLKTDGEIELTKKVGGTTPMALQIFNLVKCIVGPGCLALPAGIAAFANSPSAVIPSLILTVAIGSMSAYGFLLIGRTCNYVNATSYKDAWAKSVSPQTSWIPNLSSLVMTFGSVLAYSIVLADMVPKVLTSFLGITIQRRQALLGLTTSTLLPLCLLRSMTALAPFSLVGTSGMVFSAIAIGLRFFDGSYRPGGQFYSQIPAPPHFGSQSSLLTAKVFIFISMLSKAFMAHYNAPNIYKNLKDNTIPRFSRMVGISYGSSFAIIAAVMSLAFLTFGSACGSIVTTNYAMGDTLMSLVNIAIVMAVVFAYPLAFAGLRGELLDFLGVKGSRRTQRTIDLCSVGLLTIETGLALVLKNVGPVMGLQGATVGNFLTFLYPTFMFYMVAKKRSDLKKEVPVALTTGALGIVMAVIGTSQAIKAL